jgi:uncharacterized membrane protein YdjX (TVP38/TMEM64 family)
VLTGSELPPRRGLRSRLAGDGVVAVLGLGALLALKLFVAEDLLHGFMSWIRGLGPLGPLIFIGLYIPSTLVFVPTAILCIGAGAVFGLFAGSVYVSIGATLGATCAFVISRHIANSWVAARLEHNQNFKAIDRAVAREGWKIVGLARLSPFFPFNVLNYAFGLTAIPLKDYFFATWAGMMPGVVMYVYLGSLASDVAGIKSDPASKSAAQWTVEVIGFVVAVAVTAYVTYVAGKALRQRTVS